MTVSSYITQSVVCFDTTSEMLEITLEILLKHKVSLKKTEEGYAVWAPGLPGCWPRGQTQDGALENIKDAIEAYLGTVEELSKGQLSLNLEVG